MKILGALVVAGPLLGVLAFASPAYAAITEADGNVQPVMHDGQAAAGVCATGERWVYVSSAAEANYNPLAKKTDSLGANSAAPPNANADVFNDGVTIGLASNGKSVSFSINEAVDPSTTVAVDRVVVKAGSHFTIYTGADVVQNTALTSPANAGPPGMGVSHAYVCYSATAPAVTPEVPYAIILPLGGIAIGGVAFTLRRRRRLSVG